MENKAFNSSHRFGKWMREYHLGRSMIEILGVLAIIGVLSIGGLYAYRQAMTRYQVGKVQNLIQYIRLIGKEKCAFADACQFSGDFTKDKALFCNTLSDGNICDEFPFALSLKIDRGVAYFYIYNIPESVCLDVIKQPIAGATYFYVTDSTWNYAGSSGVDASGKLVNEASLVDGCKIAAKSGKGLVTRLSISFYY